ncbi:hypothetical protein [Nocardia goodfellowii]|uniref:Uncharacterized protein n=1 Tax=Nocardia goodfellowii TaxID=882446 RepID=A0ABS4QLB1_9NOCA|nr:hypothetical protein [Nocardia goodfellowii]MBP2192501.1 hypothetical protein [Nocardia goodfellowii]
MKRILAYRRLAGKIVEASGGRRVKLDLDLDCLSGLSADALPAIERLPESRRSQIAASIRADLEANT